MTAEASEAPTAEEPKGWTPELMMQLREVEQVRISQDGSRVVYTVRETVMSAEKSEFVTQLHLVNADSSNSIQLTFGEKSSSNAQWSPDGNSLVFASNRKEHQNLYLLRLGGGEAEPLTEAKSDIGAFSWSPDGAWVAYLQPDPVTEEEKANKGRDDSRWVDENHKLNRLYLLPIAADSQGKREPRALKTLDRHITAFDWTADSKAIVFTHMPTPIANDWPHSALSRVEVASGEECELVPTGQAPAQPFCSPDGQWIALTMSDDTPPHWAGSSVIHLLPVAGGELRKLSATPDSQALLVGWSADSNHLYFAEANGTTTRFASLAVETGELMDLSLGQGESSDFHLNASRTHVGFTHQNFTQPVEGYVAALADYVPRAVTKINGSLPQLPHGKTEVIRWQSEDDFEIEGLLTYPVDYQVGSRVPLLLVIHGGPTGVFQQSYIGNLSVYPLAAFAANGYAILRCNPRGSSGYGKAFRFANQCDWGGGDYLDIMAGVDHVIGLGVADADRLGVMGWSYGGFMTSWVITHTQRFKAASAGAAVTNLVSFTGTADIPDFIPTYFGGQFWEVTERHIAHSPIFHVKGVTTPSLIQHGDADVRVPISQGYELYNALKAQGVPTRMLVLPRQPHSPNEPKMMLKTLQTNLEWFDQYLGKKN